MARTVNAKQAALRKAREKRLELDADRDARDRRVEEATAEVLLLLDRRVEMEAAAARLDERIGDALRRLLGEGTDVTGAAQLVGLTPADVRRRTKMRSGDTIGEHRPHDQ